MLRGAAQGTYYANRAAVSLQLGNNAGAAEDAEEAVKRQPTHQRMSAHLRAGRAYLALRKPVVRAHALRWCCMLPLLLTRRCSKP